MALTTPHLRLLQEVMAEKGLFGGSPSGKADSSFDAAVAGLVEKRAAELTQPPDKWSAARKRVAALQLVCKDEECDPGGVDGLFGKLTDEAAFELRTFRETGARPMDFRDIEPLDANPHGWPRDHGDQSELFDWFDFDPRRGGEPPTVMVSTPWRLRLTFNPSLSTGRIAAHPKVAESLERVLLRLRDHYGEAEIKRLRLDMYGGCKNVRRKRGGSTWSTHSFAAALDWDDPNNQLRWGMDRATLARPDYLDFWRVWEEEGWVSLGRRKNFDWMHVQAIKL